MELGCVRWDYVGDGRRDGIMWVMVRGMVLECGSVGVVGQQGWGRSLHWNEENYLSGLSVRKDVLDEQGDSEAEIPRLHSLMLFLPEFLSSATPPPDNCTLGDVRLVGGNASIGEVQVCYGNVWGSVCYAGWDNRDAGVVCKQLGFTSGERERVCVYMCVCAVCMFASVYVCMCVHVFLCMFV